jgi:phosphohistidine phosphatase
MDLYLIRHAHAVDGAALRDEDRPLSAHGRRQALAVGGALAKEAVRFGLIVASPLVRAVETASLIAVATSYDGGLDIVDPLRPEGSYKALVREVIEPALERDLVLALVGHEPSIGHTLSKALQQKGLTMSKAAIVRLRFTSVDEAAELVWAISPQSLVPSRTLDV